MSQGRILALRDKNLTYKEISNKIKILLTTTVKRIVKKETTDRKYGSGTFSMVSEAQRVFKIELLRSDKNFLIIKLLILLKRVLM
ncbi:hypothetical protein EHP00_1395 [Ecytonucleospora hepatopenaei]|uniref:Uncharacterized protein n=1 Tax=Ecytonucleospora hepatopenaei TaxID=646526 RepID=A0A1W0E8V5_9MICR|nr:hypothetical protein EHP00_1395 [Ecytonucleospora hepatopenaei]